MYALDAFDFDLRTSITETLWVASGWSTVAMGPGVCGVGGCFAPPQAAPATRLAFTFEVDGVAISDNGRPGMRDDHLLYAGGSWQLDSIERRGTYHRRPDSGHRRQHSGLVSVEVRSRLTPLHGHPGYVLEIVVDNRSERDLDLRVLPIFEPGSVGAVPLGEWGWMPAEPTSPADRAAEAVLIHGATSALLPYGAEARFSFAVLLDGTQPSGSPADWAADARARSAQRNTRALERIPRLTSPVPGLEAYYRRSLASALVCLWDNPAFATVPFVATSGIDGGGLCSYAWDTGGYAPHTLSLMLGSSVNDIVESAIDADLTDHYAVALDGSGTGVAYAYSGWSMIMLGYAAACQYGISADLVGRLHETEARLADRFAAVGALRDYGDQHNLLEMRASGWEHVVASPNAERAWGLEMLAELSAVSGAGLPVRELRSEAERIRSAIGTELWDAEAGWFRSLHPGGHSELIYSVQAFDALRAGACTPVMADALVSQLRDGAFLFPYGVSSVSSEDRVHYELGDVDWSGGGAYTGETPQLALNLWEQGRPQLAWDVLRRVLWMGQHFGYFPQDHYCDRPAVQLRGRRTNVVAGLAGAEAIVFGLAGLRPRPDGGLDVAPPAWLPGDLRLDGLRYRDREIDLELSDGRLQVTVDRTKIISGPPTEQRILA